MTILRSIFSTTSAAILPAAVAAAAAAATTSPSSSPAVSLSLSLKPFKALTSLSLSPFPVTASNRDYSVPKINPIQASVSMNSVSIVADSPVREEKTDVILPELMTEFMVDMKCEGCVSAVKNKLQTLQGVSRIDADLENQVVRVLGSTSLKTLTDALEQTGRKARLIGQGSPDDFLVSAAVAEFKGPIVYGVARFAQVNMELARIEANLSGLSLGRHGWSINEYGDLTEGAASTGKVFNPSYGDSFEEAIGDLGTLSTNENGEAYFSGVKKNVKIVDLIGRAAVVYETVDKSIPGIAAAVIARSAGVGENYKNICACDGTIIWESTSTDYTST